jgi:DNA repair protein RecO (recombination protein O)
MDWSDDGIVLAVRPFGEHGAILEALTRSHGRHLGLMRGAGSRGMRGALEPGNLLSLHWRARMDNQLGSFSAEIAAVRAAHFFQHRLKLDGLAAACAMACATLPEREVHERVFLALDGLLQHMVLEGSSAWVASYVRFELLLLEDLGFGLDLESCAVTGAREKLTYVSPRSGRAVTAAGAGALASRLLRLPGFLLDPVAPVDGESLVRGLSLTGHFLERFLSEAHGKGLPEARLRFAQGVEKA